MFTGKRGMLGGSSSGSVELQNRSKQSKSKSSAIPIRQQKTSLKIGQKITANGIVENLKSIQPNEQQQNQISNAPKDEEIVDAFFGEDLCQMQASLAANFPTHLCDSQEALFLPNKNISTNSNNTNKNKVIQESQDILSKMKVKLSDGGGGHNLQAQHGQMYQKQYETDQRPYENQQQPFGEKLPNSKDKRENQKGTMDVLGSLEAPSEGSSSSSSKQKRKSMQNYQNHMEFTFQNSKNPETYQQQGQSDPIIGKKATESGDINNQLKLKRNFSHDPQGIITNGVAGLAKTTSQTAQQNILPQKGSYGATSSINEKKDGQSRGNFSLIDTLVIRKNGKYTDDYDDVSQDCSQKDGKKLIMLGRGGFGQVFLIRQKGGSGEERAMKIVLKSFQEAYREVMMLKKFSHPNVLKIYEYFEDDQSIYVITERCYGYNLFDYIILKGQFSEQQTCKIADGVLRALSEAHKQGIVHRDVKPENIMLDFNDARDSFVVKLIDWGLAEQLPPGENTFLTKRCGTLHYLAPEVLSKHYNEKVDLWSLGMVLYTLIQGSPPICGRSQQEVLGQVKDFTCNFRYYCWKNVSDEAKDLILKLLDKDYTKRISAKEALKHPWFLKFHNTTAIDTQDLRLSYDNLLQYAQQNTFKKTVLGFFASHTISKRERAKYIEIFQTLDADKNGELSVEELKSGFSKLFSDQEYNVCHNEIEKIFFQSLSSRFENASGIKYEEFLSSMLACSAIYSKDQLMDAFNLFDKDGNGKITLQEIVQTLGIGESKELVQSFKEIIEQFDSNNDQQIDFNEFVQIMTNFLDKHSQSILSQEMYLQ